MDAITSRAGAGSRRAGISWLAGTLLICLACLVGPLAGTAHAAGSSISIASLGPDPQPTGSPSTYAINFTCSSVVSDTCGSDPTIMIPLNLTSTNPATPDMATWRYDTASSPAGIIQSAGVQGENYVITLNPSAVVPGDSDTITLSVAPPNNVTPDGTTWSLQPSFASDEIPAVVAPTPATGAATAGTLISTSKNTNDGGAIYVVGHDVIFNIIAQCNPGGSSGNLYVTSGSLVDTLPPQLTFVSATPTPSSVSGQAVTWDYPSSGSLPAGCSADGTGTTNYTLTALLDPATPPLTSVLNQVRFSATPLGATTLETTTAQKQLTAVATSPSPAGDFVGKSSLGPLNIPGLGFHGTFPGHWINPINPTPGVNSPGAAEGQYTVSVNYPASRAYQTDLVDPVPCLTAPNGVVYQSSTVTGPLTDTGSPSIDNLCTAPAFNPTVVRVNSASLGLATAGGWRPLAILTSGARVPLTLRAGVYFEIPAADVGHVAAVELPRNGSLTDNSLSMNVWGYADGSFAGGEVLHDIASVTAYPTTGTSLPNTETDTADLYIEPTYPQLGVYKSFGAVGGAPGGTTALNLQGTLTLAIPPVGNVVLTDLLPFGLSWHNPVATAPFTVSSEQGGAGTTVTATVSDLRNFENTGRELIRVSLPRAAFTSGFYTITPPANFIDLDVPVGAATYDNTDQLFINDSDDRPRNACGPGTGTTAATFESYDPLDLDGDGASQQYYCQWSATLAVPPPTGSALRLVKTVQGDQDTAPKYTPGIGIAAPGGTGVYNLLWANTGSTTLTDPVIYDILPYVGDTGVSQNQAGAARGSQFTTIFAGVTSTLSPGVTVAYSESTNPCRPEVYPGAPGCVDDWTTTTPADLSLVKAIRITSTASYATRQSFSVSLKVRIPPDTVNVVAWNTAATTAQHNGQYLAPAEPPRVGLEASGPPATPVLRTLASTPAVAPGDPFSDSVTVTGTEGGSGTLTWSRVGPVAPAADGTCTGLDWTAAPSGPTGTVAVTGDGTYTTPDTSTPRAGCYSFVAVLDGPVFSGPVSTHPGDPGETVLVHAAGLATVASAPRILPGGAVHDAVTITGRGVGAGTLDWSLVGPLAPAPDGTCGGLDWSDAPTADAGTLAVTGPGTYQTPDSIPAATGCYSYVQQLTDDSVGGPATNPAGASGETVLVARPDLTTAISAATVQTPGSLADLITVGGTGGAPGSLAWSLQGPVVPAGGSCTAANWAGAPTAAAGTIAVSGDGTYETGATALAAAGCYGYRVTLTGDSYGGDVTSELGAAGEVAAAVNPPPPPVPPGAQPAQLTIVKRANAASVTVGHLVRYTLSVANAGPGPAQDVTVSDTPDRRLRLVSATPAPGAGSCGHAFPLTCTLGNVAAGARFTIRIVAAPLEAGVLLNFAHVQTTSANSAPPTAVVGRARVLVRVPLSLSKTASRRVARAGTTLRYVLVVANPTSVTARGAVVCDQLPAGLVFVGSRMRFALRDGRRCATLATVGPRRRIALTIVARSLRGASGPLTDRATITGSEVVRRTASATTTVIPAPSAGGGVTG